MRVGSGVDGDWKAVLGWLGDFVLVTDVVARMWEVRKERRKERPFLCTVHES